MIKSKIVFSFFIETFETTGGIFVQWHTAEINEITEKFGTNLETGLSSEQIEELTQRFGKNELTAKKKKTLFQRFLAQLQDFMVIILLIAALISLVLAFVGGEGDFVEPFIILGIVILNAVLGVIQESKAEQALDALQNMAAPHAKVLRNGSVDIIPSKDVVPGDIILVEAGDFIPADARLIEAASLKCEESALTGESLPVEKMADAQVDTTSPLGDRLNMLYSGCTVSYGHAKGLVVATGMETEMGKIAALLEGEADEMTPLQHKLAKMGKYLGILALVICIVVFFIGWLSGESPVEMFMTSVSLAVAAIPEGLPAIVTIVLALGVTRMVKKNAIIRKLPAVETLGSASVICSDKTGTLTQNRMTLTRLWADPGDLIDLTAEEKLPSSATAMLKLATLCCDASVELVDGQEKQIGDPTETCIVSAAKKAGFDKEQLNRELPRVAEIPFDSDRKLMTTVNMIGERPVVIVKGAFDVLSALCTSGDLARAQEMNAMMGQEALRVLAVAYKEIDEIPVSPSSEELESGLTLIGLMGMIDPPREEARKAVATCIGAGIRPVMITGDHVVTACAIAKQLGILREGDKALSGEELHAMSDQELSAHIRDYSVYARVSPEDKIRIVKAWQSAGEIVSMTGDGVNDAPALKAADIGCAMGITGTDVAKGAADMVLTDDNFATIVVAVREGRGIYDNIKKAVQFLLSCNLGEVLTVFCAILFGWGAPLIAIQLLLINLITDGLPALALGVEPPERDVMERKPKPKTEGIFTRGYSIQIALQGIWFGFITLIAYYLGTFVLSDGNHTYGQTMAFTVLAVSQLFHSFNVRTSHSLFTINPFSNKYLLLAFLTSLLIVAAVLFIPPLTALFKLAPLAMSHLGIAVLLSISPLVVVELAKLIIYLFNRRK